MHLRSSILLKWPGETPHTKSQYRLPTRIQYHEGWEEKGVWWPTRGRWWGDVFDIGPPATPRWNDPFFAWIQSEKATRINAPGWIQKERFAKSLSGYGSIRWCALIGSTRGGLYLTCVWQVTLYRGARIISGQGGDPWWSSGRTPGSGKSKSMCSSPTSVQYCYTSLVSYEIIWLDAYIVFAT